MIEDDKREQMTTETHKPARPLKYFKDKDGYGWRCDEMAFPTGGR